MRNPRRLRSWRTALAAFATVSAAAGLIMFKPVAQPHFGAAVSKPLGRYCLIKPGKRHTHCEGQDASPRDPVLAAIKTMREQGNRQP